MRLRVMAGVCGVVFVENVVIIVVVVIFNVHGQGRQLGVDHPEDLFLRGEVEVTGVVVCGESALLLRLCDVLQVPEAGTSQGVEGASVVTCGQTCIHTCGRAGRYADAHIHTHTYYAYTHARARERALTHAHTHTHTHTHPFTCFKLRQEKSKEENRNIK